MTIDSIPTKLMDKASMPNLIKSLGDIESNSTGTTTSLKDTAEPFTDDS